MSSPISPDKLEWYDQAVYIVGQIAIVSGIVMAAMSLNDFASTISRRYKIGKEIEEAEEAKGVI